jgi:hydrogenase nickel incorporation protein HypA/HybF
MHELGLATEILRMSRSRMPASGDFRLERVRIAVGELSAVEPELLRYAWDAVVEAGPDRGAALEVEWRPARQTCEDCGRDAPRRAGEWIRTCPACAGAMRVEGGTELDLIEFSYRPAIPDPEPDP